MKKDPRRGTLGYQPKGTSPEAMEEFFATMEDPWGYRSVHRAEHESRALEFCEMLQEFKPLSRVLDVGCAEGFVTYFLVDHAEDEIVGIDVSESAIERAEEMYGDCCSFDARGLLEFKSRKKFDAVVMTGTMYYVDFGKAVKKIGKLLKKGGVLLVSHVKVGSDGDGYLSRFERAGYRAVNSREFECNGLVQSAHVLKRV